MEDYPRPQELSQQSEGEIDNFAFHPNNVYLVLLLFGLTTMFLTLTGSYIYNRVQADLPPLQLPPLFLLNTLVLLGSSYTLMQAKKAYLSDDTAAYQRALWLTLGLSFLFLGLQSLAWYQLFTNEVFIHSDNSAGYLYVISALHFLHVVAGLPFLGLFIYRARISMKEPVSVLIYFSDPDKRLKLRLLTLYWHFLDGLWIYLVLFFVVMRWVF